MLLLFLLFLVLLVLFVLPFSFWRILLLLFWALPLPGALLLFGSWWCHPVGVVVGGGGCLRKETVHLRVIHLCMRCRLLIRRRSEQRLFHLFISLHEPTIRVAAATGTTAYRLSAHLRLLRPAWRSRLFAAARCFPDSLWCLLFSLPLVFFLLLLLRVFRIFLLGVTWREVEGIVFRWWKLHLKLLRKEDLLQKLTFWLLLRSGTHPHLGVDLKHVARFKSVQGKLNTTHANNAVRHMAFSCQSLVHIKPGLVGESPVVCYPHLIQDLQRSVMDHLAEALRGHPIRLLACRPLLTLENVPQLRDLALKHFQTHYRNVVRLCYGSHDLQADLGLFIQVCLHLCLLPVKLLGDASSVLVSLFVRVDQPPHCQDISGKDVHMHEPSVVGLLISLHPKSFYCLQLPCLSIDELKFATHELLLKDDLICAAHLRTGAKVRTPDCISPLPTTGMPS
mmetsp:Transcript_161063/g.296995  ORF Transcript_161063/g.296995 Transcript_161063/m.296995 type:complete len:450 (-) Transcript_161063:2385-3734(-)